VPWRALNLLAQDPTSLGLDPLFRDPRHRGGIAGEIRLRQTICRGTAKGPAPSDAEPSQTIDHP
jgi:hypothetical protein